MTREEQDTVGRGHALSPERQADLNFRLEAARVALLSAPALIPFLK